MPKTWFLPPDFTFTSDGPIQLGTVIAHPTRPTIVLAVLSGESDDIILPKPTTLLERKHIHETSASSSGSVSAFAKLLDQASASVKTEAGRNSILSYGSVDHEIRSFASPLLPGTVSAIAALPDVRTYMDSGLFGKKPVYVVSGLRIAVKSFEVKKETGSNLSVKVEGSGPPAGGAVPVELGGGVDASRDRKVVDSYETAPGIVFAYRVHVIRPKRAGLETELFSDKGAFLTGDGYGEEDEPLVFAEATKEELDGDLEDPVNLTTLTVGDDQYCLYLEEHLNN